MEKTTEALRVELPIDLVAGKVDAEGIIKPVKDALDEVSRKLSSDKVRFHEIGFDEAQIRQKLFKLPELVKEASSKAMKTLGSGLATGDIASEFAKRLKTSEGVVNSQGKVLVKRAREILKEIAAETGHSTKGLTNGKGGNQLSDLLAIQGKSLDDAISSIRAKSKDYRSLIRSFSETPANFKKGQFAELSTELNRLSVKLKELRGHDEYLHKIRLSEAEKAGNRSVGDHDKVEKDAASDKRYLHTLRLKEAKIAGDRAVSAHDKAEKDAADNAQYLLKLKLAEAARVGKESTAKAERFEGLKQGSSRLLAGRDHATSEEYLKDVNAQAQKVREALKDFNPTVDKTQYEWLEGELKRLRDLADATREAIDSTKLRGAAESKGAGILKAESKVSRARAHLEDAQSHLTDLPDNASARERLQLLTAQRNATEDLVASIRNLKREEDKEYEAKVKLRNEVVKAFGGDPDMPVRPDSSGHMSEIAKYNKSIAGLNEQLSGLDNLWNKVSQSMGLFLRYAVIYQLFYKITGSVTALVQSVISLQNALVNIKAVTSATFGQMVDVAASIKNVAETTSFSTSDVAKGAQTLVQAGIPLKDFATSLKATADLASSTGSEFQATADVISTYRQVYKDMDVQTIADKIRNAVNMSKLDMQGVQTMANYMLETSEAYKISLDSMQGALTTLKNAGIKDSTAGTGLRQGILELLSPDAKTLKALQARYAKLGISMSQDAIKAMFMGFKDAKNPILEVINELQKLGMGGTGDNDLARVFDVRAENVIKTLIQNKEAMIANEVAMRQTGTAAEGAKTQLESLQNSFQNLGETIVSMVHSASAGFIDDLVVMLHKGTDMLNDFSKKVTERKAATGDTGLGSAIATGLGTAAASLAGKASLGVSATRGVLAFIGVEAAKIFAPASTALQNLARAAEAAATALTFLTILKSIPSLAGRAGRVVVGDRVADKVADALGAGAAGGAAAGAAAVGTVKVWGARLATLGRFITGPVGTIVTTALLFAADYFGLWSKLFGGGEKEKLAEIAKAKQSALADQAADLKAQEKTLQDAAREAGIRKENQRLLEGSVSDMQEVQGKYTNNSPVQITREVNAGQVTSILDRASKGTVALGTQELEDIARQIEDKMGRASGELSRYDLSSDLQKLDTVFQQVESARKTYVDSIVKAQEDLAKDPADLKAKSAVDAWNSLSRVQQRAILSVTATSEDVKSVVEAMGKLVGDKSPEGSLTAAKNVLVKQLEQVDNIIAQLGGADAAANKQRLQSMMDAAVNDGSVALVERIIARTNLFDPGLLRVARNNRDRNFLAPFKEAQKANTDQIVLPEKRVNPAQFDAEFAEASGEASARNADTFSKRAELEKQLSAKRSQLDLFTSNVSISPSETINEKNRARLTDLTKEIADIQAKIASTKKDELEGEESLKAAQRGFIIDEEQIKSLQDKLKTVHGARLHSVKEEVALLKEIFGVQSQQLEVEKQILAKTLAKLVEKETNLDTTGLSPEGLLKAMSGPAGKAAIEKSKDLADATEALVKVVNKQRDLQDKYNTDVDNAQRKDLDAKEKAAKSAYDKQVNKTSSLESKLQTATDRLIAAREKLRAAYEKQAELEDFFKNQLREVAGEKMKAQDVKNVLTQANDTSSPDLAKQAASDAKALYDSGAIGKSEAESYIKQARDIALSAQANVIENERANVFELSQSQASLSAAVDASRASQDRLKTSLDSLTGQISKLNGEAAANGTDLSQTDKYGNVGSPGSLPMPFGGGSFSNYWEGGANNAWQTAKNFTMPSGNGLPSLSFHDNTLPGYAHGGLVDGPGTGTSDSVLARLSDKEFVQPESAVNVYGKDFMDRLRNLQVSPAAVRSLVSVGTATLGATTATQAVDKQPIMFNVGGNVIRAEAPVDAVNQFKNSMQLMSLKQGRR